MMTQVHMYIILAGLGRSSRSAWAMSDPGEKGRVLGARRREREGDRERGER